MGMTSISNAERVLRAAKHTIDEIDQLAHGLSLLGKAAARVGQVELTELSQAVEAELLSRAQQLRALVPPEPFWTGP